MSRVQIPRTKADVERSYHQGFSGWDENGRVDRKPMLNVKTYPWWPDAQPFKTEGHEFSGDTEFWEWAEAHERDCDHGSETCPFNRAWEFACEDGWERAAEEANGDRGHPLMSGWTCRLTPRDRSYHDLGIWSAGRSGGWLVVEGLPNIEDWDAIMLARWRRFAKDVSDLVDDLPYQWIWQLHENFWQPIADKRAIKADDDAAAQLPILATI